MAEALLTANEPDAQRQTAGFDQIALDEAARRCFDNGALEDNGEESSAVIEEFFPVEANAGQHPSKPLPQQSSEPGPS